MPLKKQEWWFDVFPLFMCPQDKGVLKVEKNSYVAHHAPFGYHLTRTKTAESNGQLTGSWYESFGLD